ncbi:MAG: hypothetical protein HPY61_02385 [Methanotrichaceae archaeon]|nr:hypothetical protein [Methanotrichaceae archaeon]
MKGVALAAILLVAFMLGCCGIVVANPPIVPPVQYEQFCEAQKISGTGVIDVSTSIVDKKIALEYYNVMSGDGDIELDQENAYSQNADKLKRNVTGVNGSDKVGLNLFESTKLTYSGATPLVGGKYLHSKEFYGGIGAEIQEMFAVNEMEKEQTSFFTSTTPFEQIYGIAPEDLGKALNCAGRNTDMVDGLMRTSEGVYIPTHVIGLDTKNSFNGTWGTDATWHKIFYKDIKAHEMFTGKFEAEKLLKFHEYPVPEKERQPCEGIDC